MIKLLIGGSPCTYWSIAQTNRRETEAAGLGWELFKNYLIAKEKFCPDFFLYENNKSAAQAVKNQIKLELDAYDGTFCMKDTGVRYIEINSSLVSAQNRERFYIHNCGNVEQPQDRGILLSNILETGATDAAIFSNPHGFNRGGIKYEKAPTLTANGKWEFNNLCVESTPINTTANGKAQCLRATYCDDGIRNLVANKNDRKTCVAIPVNQLKNGKARCVTGGYATKGVAHILESNYSENPNKQKWDCVAVLTDKYSTTAVTPYEVRDGFIEIKGKLYPIKLPNGFYLIRKLSVVECARLQTMPDNYCRAVSKTQAYKGLGNGWTAEVIIHILQHALKSVSKNEKIVVLSMYDGIGTGRYCLDKMGFANVEYYAYEIDKHAIAIAQSNYPDIIQCGDAFNLRSDNWALPAKK